MKECLQITGVKGFPPIVDSNNVLTNLKKGEKILNSVGFRDQIAIDLEALLIFPARH